MLARRQNIWTQISHYVDLSIGERWIQINKTTTLQNGTCLIEKKNLGDLIWSRLREQIKIGSMVCGFIENPIVHDLRV